MDISTDRWSDDLWGVTKSNTESQMNNDRTKLFFYFGEQDHWVANRTRDELIAARASTGRAGDEDKPFMEVDRGGMPHGFCIRECSIWRCDSVYSSRIMQVTVSLSQRRPLSTSSAYLRLRLSGQ